MRKFLVVLDDSRECLNAMRFAAMRAANTGVSAMIDPLGQITAAVPLNQPGAVTAALPAALAPTVYARTGDWPVFLLALILTAVMVLLQVRARRAN